MGKTPQQRIAQIEEELRRIEIKKEELRSELEELRRLPAPESVHQPLPGGPTTPDEKIALFLSLFRCRESVFPRLWENSRSGKKGYSPVCLNEWARGICEKPRIKCAECLNQRFSPLDEEAVLAHLTGRQTIGTYAIREDNTCVFLAADFDGDGWEADVTAYRDAAGSLGMDVAVERSRSGQGAHGWIFFAASTPATLARRLGTLITAKASSLHSGMKLVTYDRFFPNQDMLPDGGFGNLIALPLQKAPREHGNTVFLDKDLRPIADQWSYPLTSGRTRSRDESLSPAIMKLRASSPLRCKAVTSFWIVTRPSAPILRSKSHQRTQINRISDAFKISPGSPAASGSRCNPRHRLWQSPILGFERFCGLLAANIPYPCGFPSNGVFHSIGDLCKIGFSGTAGCKPRWRRRISDERLRMFECDTPQRQNRGGSVSGRCLGANQRRPATPLSPNAIHRDSESRVSIAGSRASTGIHCDRQRRRH